MVSKAQQRRNAEDEFRSKYEVRFPTVQEFKSYLGSLSKDTSVTKFCKSGACPIAQWALDTLELPKSAKIYVSGDEISVSAISKTFPVETTCYIGSSLSWVAEFISLVDQIQGDNEDWQAVSPKQALKCLRDATKLS